MKKINHYLWKLFHIWITIEYSYPHYRPKNHKIVFAYNCFGYGERCVAKDGEFYSLNDGSKLKGIIKWVDL